MRFKPERSRHCGGVDPGSLPPGDLVTAIMDLAVVSTAQRHGELVAHFAAKCPALCKAQMMGIRGLATANQTRLLGHMSDMVAVANPARLRQRQHALIDNFRSRPVLRLRRRGALHSRGLKIPCPLRADLCQASLSSPISPGRPPRHAGHRAPSVYFFRRETGEPRALLRRHLRVQLISPSSRSRSAADASDPSYWFARV